MVDQPPPSAAPPPPPVISVPGPPSATPAVIVWSAGVVRCALRTVAPDRIEAPLVMPSMLYGNVGTAARTANVKISFRIDSRGRAIDIRREAATDGRTYYLPGDSTDIEASLAGSQFPVNQPHQACSVAYVPRIVPAAEASTDLVGRSIGGPFASAGWRIFRKQLIDAGANCLVRRLQPVTVTYPDLRNRVGTSGRIDQYAYRYDVDASGAPINIVPMMTDALIAADIDSEIRRALSASRFDADPKTGCVFGGAVSAKAPLEAPERPPMPAFAIKGAKCPFPASSLLKLADVPFPPAFQRRSIEGWAIIRFDIAPWGAVGNASVVAAEPAEAFGRAALNLIQQTRTDPSATGYSGCIAPVSYRISATGPAGVSGPNGRVGGEPGGMIDTD